MGYIGCEVIDIALMKRVGFAVATTDAINEVKEIADYITTTPGGRGPIRQTCEFVLRAMGKWEERDKKATRMGYKKFPVA